MPTSNKPLVELLLKFFSNYELQHLLSNFGPEVTWSLLNPSVSKKEFVLRAVEQLQAQRLINRSLFDLLLKERPGQSAEIEAVAATVLAKRTMRAAAARRMQWRRVGTCAGVLVIAGLVYYVSKLFSTQTIPVVFREGAAGVERVWNESRAQALAASMASHRTGIETIWPEILHGLGSFALEWEKTRVRAWDAFQASPGPSLGLASVCLQQSAESVNRVLSSIEALVSDESRLPVAWSSLAHDWMIEMRPPTRCKDSAYLNAYALTLKDRVGVGTYGDWQYHESLGFRALQDGDLEHASYRFTEILALVVNDLPVRARAYMRLAEIAVRRRQQPIALEYLTLALKAAEQSSDLYLRFYVLAALFNLSASDPEDDGGVLSLYASALGSLRGLALDNGSPLLAEEQKLHVQMSWAMEKLAARTKYPHCPIDCDGRSRSLLSCEAKPQSSSADKAFRCAQDLITLAEDSVASNRSLMIEIAIRRANLDWARRDLPAAERGARRAITLEREWDSVTLHTADAYEILGVVQHTANDWMHAEQSYRLALGVRIKYGRGAQAELLRIYLALMGFALTRGDNHAAREDGERARDIFIGLPPHSAALSQGVEIYSILSEVYLRPKDSRDEAVGYEYALIGLRYATQVAPDSMLQSHVVNMYLGLVRAALRRGDVAHAQWLLATSARQPEQIDGEFLAMHHILAAEVDLRLGYKEAASKRLEHATRALSSLTHPPSRHVPAHRDWLDARIRGPRDQEAQRLARGIITVLAKNPSLADEFLDEALISDWVRRIPR